MIFPMIVAVTIMMLAAAVYIYGLTSSCSDYNRLVRREAGVRSDTVFYNETTGPKTGIAEIEESGGLFFKKVSVLSKSSYVSSVIFSMKKKNEYKAEAFVICEAKELWNRQVVGNAVEDLTG